MTAAERSGLERLRYWEGQTLRSRDFNDQLAREASLRWWHNRAIHDTWGVVSGLWPQVTGQEVSVSRGLAYDGFGRELILPEERRLSLPPFEEDQGWELLMRAACRAPGQALAAELVWSKAGPVFDPCRGVPIARGKFVSDTLFELDIDERPRLIRKSARPKLGNGSTIRGKTDWRTWTPESGVGGIEVRIDTSAAGFERTPCYVASLQGDALALVDQGFVFLPFARVFQATPVSFAFNLWLPFTGFAPSPSGLPASPVGIVEAARRELSVCWLGIEPWASEPAFEKEVSHGGD